MARYQQQPSPQFQYPQQWQPPQYNPNAGMQPEYYGYQQGAAGNPALSYQPDLSSNDPDRIFRNAQNVNYNMGAGLSAQTNQMYGQQMGMYGNYGNLMNQSYGQLAETPGYTDEESANITREPQYMQGITSQEQYQGLNPTDQEYAGMTGDPNSYYNSYDPAGADQITTSGAEQQRNASNLAGGDISGATGRQRDSLGQAINPGNLRTSQAYGDNMDSVLNATHGRLGENQSSTTGRLDKAVYNPDLGISSGYSRKAGMSDEEVNQVANAGARDVGLRYQSMMGDAARRAAEAGNASPLAVGALQARLAQQSATGAADARTNAYLAARGQQRQAETGVESTRLGAEQYRTGAQLGAGQFLGAQGQQAAEYEGGLAQQGTQSKENTRLGAEQYLTGAQVGAANALGQNELQGAEYMGGLRSSNEAQISNRNLQANQYQQGLGTQIAQNVEQTNAQRQAALYGNRAALGQYQQGQTYGQNFNTQGALSQGYGNVANARRGGQQEYRGWTGAQTGQALGAAQTATGQGIQNYGTMSGAMNSNARDWTGYQAARQGMSMGTQLKRGIGTGVGTLIGRIGSGGSGGSGGGGGG